MCAEGDKMCSLKLSKKKKNPVIWCIKIKIVMLNSHFLNSAVQKKTKSFLLAKVFIESVCSNDKCEEGHALEQKNGIQLSHVSRHRAVLQVSVPLWFTM